MAKLTTDKALSILIDSEQAKKVLKPSYIRQVKHRLKTGKNLELSKKIEILEKLGAVANELTWNVKTNGKTDLKKAMKNIDTDMFFIGEPNSGVFGTLKDDKFTSSMPIKNKKAKLPSDYVKSVHVYLKQNKI